MERAGGHQDEERGEIVGPLSWAPWLFEKLRGDKVGLCSGLPASGRAEPALVLGTSALERMGGGCFLNVATK